MVNGDAMALNPEADVKARPRPKTPLVQCCALRLKVLLLGKEGTVRGHQRCWQAARVVPEAL